jgi:hypothetical protein
MSKLLVGLTPGSTMFRLASYVGIILACCILVTPSFASELVANGGFETGNFSGWTQLPASSGSDFYVASNYPHSGLHQAFFGAGGQYDDSILQTLTTIPLQTYKIDFWLAHPYYDSYANFTASWDGSQVLSLVNTNFFYYTDYTFTEVATSTSTILQFSGRESVSSISLDDVSVQPIPEPASLVLFSAGVFGFLAYIYRKRKKAG